MKFTFYGHACFSVEINGKQVLFDPFISPNEKASDIDVNSIEADYILLTHGHGDHVADVESIAKRTGAKLVGNYEVVNWFGNKGIENNHPLNHGGAWNFDDIGHVKYVNAVHSSSFPDGSYGGNPGGFIITHRGGCFYNAGDTALMMDMQIFGDQNDLDFAVLPIGDNFTMGYEDAAIAAKWLKVRRVVGMHYDTFGYIEIDHEKAKEAFKKQGVELLLPEIGETIQL